MLKEEVILIMSYQLLGNLIKFYQSIICQAALEEDSKNAQSLAKLRELNFLIVGAILHYLQTGKSTEWNAQITKISQEFSKYGFSYQIVLAQLDLVIVKIKQIVEQYLEEVALQDKNKYFLRLQGLQTMAHVSLMIADADKGLANVRQVLSNRY